MLHAEFEPRDAAGTAIDWLSNRRMVLRAGYRTILKVSESVTGFDLSKTISFSIGALLISILLIQENLGSTVNPPNILIILADDLGFSDIGCYGGEIETPALDQLAADGLRLTNFYNTGRCWPTRASLLTGYYAQQVGRDRLPGRKRGGAGAKRPKWAKLLPQLLKQRDYRAYHSGKWHIDATPLKGGFDHSYWTPDHGRFFSPKRHLLDDVRLAAVTRGTGYYATTAIADHAIEFLQDHKTHHHDKPFLSYVAFIAPHFPLHALPEDIQRYKGKYEAGWDVIRKQRWQRISKMGWLHGELSAVEPNIGPPYHFEDAIKNLGPDEVNRPIPWGELTPEQQKFQSTKMAIHAAMVHRMDIEIGRIVSQLRKMNALENTLILFLSDNGASAEIMVRDDGHDPDAQPGSADTHLCLGPGWSTVCNTPFRRHKTWVHEGGTATPMIVHWPKKLAKPGTFCHSPSHVIDVVPTVLDIARGDDKPKTTLKNQNRGNDAPVPKQPGRSLLSSLVGDGDQTSDSDYWWLHEGNRALRRGKWKLVSARDQPWELYDLSVDRCETQDLAAKNPDVAKSLENSWQQRVKEFTEQTDVEKTSQK